MNNYVLKVIIFFFIFFVKHVNLYVINGRGIISVLNTNNNLKNIREGVDERFPKNSTEHSLLQNITNYHYKYILLNKLESNDISQISKLKLIEDEFQTNEIKPFNILSGGLFDDFNMDIE